MSATTSTCSLPSKNITANLPIWNRLSFVFLTVVTALRLIQLRSFDLVPDEAYYWDWSRHLSLGYYDNGPMIAYIVHVTTLLFGTNEFGVRVGACLLSLGTAACIWYLASRIFSLRAAFIATVLVGLTPLMEVGSVISTYDPPLVFFWSLSLVLLYNALFATESGSGRVGSYNWVALGFAMGMGLMTKQTIVLLIPSLLVFFFFTREYSGWLRRWQPWVAVCIMLMCYSGVIWWNAMHHWWTFRHLLFLEHKSHHTAVQRLGNFIGSQALLLGPVLFGGCVAALLKPLRAVDNRADARIKFLVAMAAPSLLFFCMQALKAKVQGNWCPFAWNTPSILWAGMLSARLDRGSNSSRAVWGIACAAAAMSLFLTMVIFLPGFRKSVGLRLPPSADITNTAAGWRNLAMHVESLRMQMERTDGKPVFICGNNYEFPAEMAFYMPGHPHTFDMFLHWRLTMYAAYIHQLKGKLGDNAIFLDVWRHNDPDLRALFQSVTWQPDYLVWRRPLYSRPVANISIAQCFNFTRYVGLHWASGG